MESLAGNSGPERDQIPPFRSLTDSVAVPLPVAPAVAFVAHAAPTDALAVLDTYSQLAYSDASVPGDVVVQTDQVGVEELAAAAIPNMITAALAEAVVMPVAVTVVEPPVLASIATGVTSKGPPAVPSCLTPPVVSTPEKATMEPTAAFTPDCKAKAKLDPLCRQPLDTTPSHRYKGCCRFSELRSEPASNRTRWEPLVNCCYQIGKCSRSSHRPPPHRSAC